MKKILLLALPLMVMCFASCEKDNGNGELSGDDIIQFQDPNFLEALLTVRNIPIGYDEEANEILYYTLDVDTNNDGQISVNEAKNIHVLDLTSNYETYDGFNVQSMPEIKYFTSLEILYCNDNQLSSLDLSNNIALKSLDCTYNKLTSLNISKNTELESLLCFDNQLTALDISNNVKLREFDCSNNPLKTLTISPQNAEWSDYVKEEYPNIKIEVKK